MAQSTNPTPKPPNPTPVPATRPTGLQLGGTRKPTKPITDFASL